MNEATIQIPTPVRADQLRMMLAHAEAMAFDVTITVETVPRRVVLQLGRLRRAEPVAPVAVRNVVATTVEEPEDATRGGMPWVDGPGPDADELEEMAQHVEETRARQIAEGIVCPADLDGEHHPGCGCDLPTDEDLVEDEGDIGGADCTTDVAPEPTPPAAGLGHQGDGATKRAILEYLLDHGAVASERGDAGILLADRLAYGAGSAWNRHLKQLDEAGLIARVMPHARSVTRIAATDAAARARTEGGQPWGLSTRDRVLAHLAERGPVESASGKAATVLFGRLGLDTSDGARNECLAGLEDDQLIVRERSGTKTYRVALVDQVPADDERTGVVRPRSQQLVLDHLAEHGPVVDESGRASALLLDELDGVVSTQTLNKTVRALVAEGLVVRHTVATRTYEIRLAGQEVPEPEAEPAPAVDEAPIVVDDAPDPPEPDVGWDFMRRTDRADREATGSDGNVLDSILGPEPKGRPLIDSVEVIEELTAAELAAAIGKAGR